MKHTSTALLFLLLATRLHAETLVESLLAGYEQIQSVSCEVRRDTESGGNRIRALSRVHFQRTDKLHVENVSPFPRRIVSDGTNFFSYAEGDTKGFSRPVAGLDQDMLISLRKVPGSAMDHLLRLRGLSETNLPPTPEFPVQRAYNTEKLTARLSMDTSNRLCRIEFFADPAMTRKTAQTDYSNFKEALPGVWLSALHQTTVWMVGAESHETSRFDNLSVNQPIAANLFNAGLFFTKVSFVSSIQQIYQ